MNKIQKQYSLEIIDFPCIFKLFRRQNKFVNSTQVTIRQMKHSWLYCTASVVHCIHINNPTFSKGIWRHGSEICQAVI